MKQALEVLQDSTETEEKKERKETRELQDLMETKAYQEQSVQLVNSPQCYLGDSVIKKYFIMISATKCNLASTFTKYYQLMFIWNPQNWGQESLRGHPVKFKVSTKHHLINARQSLTSFAVANVHGYQPRFIVIPGILVKGH